MWQLPFFLIWLCYNYRWLQISFCFPLPHAVIHMKDVSTNQIMPMSCILTSLVTWRVGPALPSIRIPMSTWETVHLTFLPL